jgi:Holliday junction DNA helicase RuvA
MARTKSKYSLCYYLLVIYKITGKLLEREVGYAVIEAGGIGYKVFATAETLNKISKNTEKEISLWTKLAIKEDSWDLYGFIDKEEMGLFELLISISGIGPKTGIAVLNASSIENLKTAIASGDTSYLTKISGIGRKIAEKIIFELREKVGGSKEAEKAMQGDSDVLEALQSLGYNERDAREAVKKLPKEINGTSNRVKEALKVLGK